MFGVKRASLGLYRNSAGFYRQHASSARVGEIAVQRAVRQRPNKWQSGQSLQMLLNLASTEGESFPLSPANQMKCPDNSCRRPRAHLLSTPMCVLGWLHLLYQMFRGPCRCTKPHESKQL